MFVKNGGLPLPLKEQLPMVAPEIAVPLVKDSQLLPDPSTDFDRKIDWWGKDAGSK